MSYGIKKGSGQGNPIVITRESAISEGRFISNLEYRKTETAEYLSVSVTDKTGRFVRRSYFPPKMGVGFVNSTEIFDREQGKLNRVIENIAKVFLGNDYETGEVKSFEEFCKKVVTDIGSAYVDKELRIKLVYDSKGRVTLPGYAPIFEDPTIIAADVSNLKIGVRDRVEQVEIKMDDDKEDDGLTLPKKTTSEDDLPFD